MSTPVPARRRPARSGGDVLLIPFILLIFIGSCIFGLIRNQPPPGVEFGDLDDYPPGAVVHFEQYHLFIVRLRDQQNTQSGGVLAVSDRDPGSRCQITSAPSEKFYKEDGSVVEGLFKDSCQGTAYSLSGIGVSGPGRANNLRLFTVRLVDGKIYVEVPSG